jgi:hypothetical protein
VSFAEPNAFEVDISQLDESQLEFFVGVVRGGPPHTVFALLLPSPPEPDLFMKILVPLLPRPRPFLRASPLLNDKPGS